MRVVHALCALGLLAGTSLPAQVVISQVYGGGGNAGATYRQDFVELFNRGAVPVSLAGYSIQYASGTGAIWQKADLAGTLQPGRYYLVQMAAGTGGSVDLPAPDATGGISMSASSGKVVLAATTLLVARGIACPVGDAVLDLVGYGANTECHRNQPVTAPGNTLAAIRRDNGCLDSGTNGFDFVAGAPAPRNSAAQVRTCADRAEMAAAPQPAAIIQPVGAYGNYSWRVSPNTLEVYANKRGRRTR